MSHREEAPRQELCMKCGRLLPRMHNCFEDSEPSCNGSQQEGQKLTAPDSSETTVTPTPLTDAILPTTHAELIAHAKSLELSLSQCREALEEARKAIREIITEDCPMQIIDDPSIVACVKADACGCCWAKHKSAIDAASAPKE
jgi:hypothetical protein